MFSIFCNRVESTGKTCHFCKFTKGCWAKKYATVDQIVRGTTKNTIRRNCFLKDYNLVDLQTNSMKYETTASGGEKIFEEHINKLGAYSYAEWNLQ